MQVACMHEVAVRVYQLQLCNKKVFQREIFHECLFQVALCWQSLKRPIGGDQFFGVETLAKVRCPSNHNLMFIIYVLNIIHLNFKCLYGKYSLILNRWAMMWLITSPITHPPNVLSLWACGQLPYFLEILLWWDLFQGRLMWQQFKGG